MKPTQSTATTGSVHFDAPTVTPATPFIKWVGGGALFFDMQPALNVDRTSEIPCDHDGLLAVPITALDRLDPKKYEIVDLIARYAVVNHSYDTPGHQLTEINGHPRYSRIIINKLIKIVES